MPDLEREKTYIDSFISSDKRSRYHELFNSTKGREKLLNRLAHSPDFIPQYMHKIQDNKQNRESILQILKSKGAPDKCYIISESSKLDGKELDLTEALDLVVGSTMGTVILCIPSKLAYYEGEDINERYILEK